MATAGLVLAISVQAGSAIWYAGQMASRIEATEEAVKDAHSDAKLAIERSSANSSKLFRLDLHEQRLAAAEAGIQKQERFAEALAKISELLSVTVAQLNRLQADVTSTQSDVAAIKEKVAASRAPERGLR